MCADLCEYVVFRTVCLGHLGVWGELASHKRLFNPPSQFSRLGTLLLVCYTRVLSCTCIYAHVTPLRGIWKHEINTRVKSRGERHKTMKSMLDAGDMES